MARSREKNSLKGGKRNEFVQKSLKFLIRRLRVERWGEVRGAQAGARARAACSRWQCSADPRAARTHAHTRADGAHTQHGVVRLRPRRHARLLLRALPWVVSHCFQLLHYCLQYVSVTLYFLCLLRLLDKLLFTCGIYSFYFNNNFICLWLGVILGISFSNDDRCIVIVTHSCCTYILYILIPITCVCV